MRFHVGDFHSAPPEVSSKSHPDELSVSTQIFTLEKATQSGRRMHIMLHGVNGGSHRVPLGNAACLYPTPQQVRRVQRQLRSFVFCFVFLPSGSWRHPLWCSVWAWERGWRRKSSARVHGTMEEWKQPKLKEVASVFVLIDLTTAESTYFYLTGSFYWTGRVNVTEMLVVERIPPSNPGFKKENRSYNHVTSHNGSELLEKDDGDCGQSIIPRAN